MAYFSNSSEGAVLQEMCSRCVHYDGCNVYFLQSEWNYEQCGKDQVSRSKKMVLDLLIPQKDGKTECTMFVAGREDDGA